MFKWKIHMQIKFIFFIYILLLTSRVHEVLWILNSKKLKVNNIYLSLKFKVLLNSRIENDLFNLRFKEVLLIWIIRFKDWKKF